MSGIGSDRGLSHLPAGLGDSGGNIRAGLGLNMGSGEAVASLTMGVMTGKNRPRTRLGCVMSNPAEDRVAGWTTEDHLAFDIGFALPRAPIKGLRRSLSEDERRAMARAIVEHLKLCGWQFPMTPIVVGHGTGKGA